jgi:hypothetical protein
MSTPAAGRWPRRLPLLFAAALFTSAALLFLVQPLAARLVLPLLGGTPAVWTTCMLFFQATLLLGYLYAHATPAWLGERKQAAVHLAVLLLPWLVLPLALPAHWPAPDPQMPVPWLLGVLLVTVGLPFFAVATTGPLLQRWFAATGHPAGRDPYYLYAASNLGSLLGLLAYPLLLEPLLPLGEQGWAWAAWYAAFLVLCGACAWALWRSPAPAEAKVNPGRAAVPPAPPPGWPRRLRWLLLAFVPSSMLLSVTLHLSTDVAAIPLLWVVPLALYLLTFVLAFARRPLVPAATAARWLPLVALVAVLVLLSEATEPAALLIPLHLAVLGAVGLFCHTSLAEDRPPAARLTEFYLWLSVGGALGGVFNALVAPHVFRGVAEYPIVLVLACALRPASADADAKGKKRPWWPDVVLPLALGAATAGLVLAVQALHLLPPGQASVAAMFAVPAVFCYTFLARPLRFALGLAALLLAGGLYQGVYGTAEFRARSFFGVHRVTIDPTHTFRMLIHGNTVHGQQFLDPARHGEPLNYYHRTGPVGRLIHALNESGRLRRVGVVGLGAGALCCYAQKGQEWTFYEIDPVVMRIAQDPEHFTYWSDCAVRPELVTGDARLTLAQSPQRYDLLVIDAFSSDAIPVHLLTREALKVYGDHLADGGVLAFNVSNRYLDLVPVLGDLAADHDPPLTCLACDDRDVTAEERRDGKSPSQWVMMTRGGREVTAGLRGWIPVPPRRGRRVWTDDYFNLLGAFKLD